MRSRCKDARKNTSQKAARKEKGASVKSAYHGYDCFGLKKYRAFCRFFFFFHRRRYYYFQSLQRCQGYASVVRSLSSRIERVRRPLLGRSSRMRREKVYTHVVVYTYIETSRSPSAPECKATYVLRARFFLPSPSRRPPPKLFSRFYLAATA